MWVVETRASPALGRGRLRKRLDGQGFLRKQWDTKPAKAESPGVAGRRRVQVPFHPHLKAAEENAELRNRPAGLSEVAIGNGF